MKTKTILKSIIILITLMSGVLSCKAESEFAAKPIVKTVGRIKRFRACGYFFLHFYIRKKLKSTTTIVINQRFLYSPPLIKAD